MMELDFYVRMLQSFAVAPAAVVTVTNDLHGSATVAFARLGIPRWFIRWIGLWKAMIITINFLHEGEYVPLAQSMLALLMGGAIFTHVAVERSVLRALPAVAILGTSVAVPIMRGASRPALSAGVTLMVAVTGYYIGVAIQRGLQTRATSKREQPR